MSSFGLSGQGLHFQVGIFWSGLDSKSPILPILGWAGLDGDWQWDSWFGIEPTNQNFSERIETEAVPRSLRNLRGVVGLLTTTSVSNFRANGLALHFQVELKFFALALGGTLPNPFEVASDLPPKPKAN